jgi:hypothetical protein
VYIVRESFCKVVMTSTTAKRVGVVKQCRMNNHHSVSFLVFKKAVRVASKIGAKKSVRIGP